MADPGANQARIDATPAGSQVALIVPAPAAIASAPAGRTDDPGARGVAGGGPTGRVPVGLVASVIVHLALVGLVAAAFLLGHQSAPPEAIPVELVPDETAAPAKSPKDSPAKSGQPGAPTSAPTPEAAPAQPEKPAADEHGPEEPGKPAPPPPPPPETSEAIEPVDIIPPLASFGSDAVGMADSSRDTTVTKDEMEDLRTQVRRCWDIPSGWTEARQVSVTIRFHLNKDGTINGKPAVVEFPASRLGKAAGDNALRAVKKCAPYKLPPEKSDQWSDVQLRLTPS